MKRQLTGIFLSLIVLSALLTAVFGRPKTENRYSETFFGVFDTAVELIGYADSEETFQTEAQKAKDILASFHRLFDAYNEYDGINNLYVLNRDASNTPVKVEEEMLEFLEYAQNLQSISPPCEVNVAMGAVLRLWHDARAAFEAGRAATVPDADALRRAGEHTDFSNVVIDREAGTVYYADPEMALDFGALAKGYAVERAAECLEMGKMTSFLINAGGNVRAGGFPEDGQSWKVGVRNPDAPGEIRDTLYVSDLSVVTSGDYERWFEADGARYGHIISPETLYPADDFRSVTVVTRDSGYADYLSTRLFLTPYEEGRALLETLRASAAWDSAEAYWIFPDGTVKMTDGMRKFLKP